VKNEAANLPRSLTALGAVYDELLVVDTGSTDATVAIAERAGARVLKYSWQDDFAAARNYLLEHCTGDWCIFLDADEWFVPTLTRQALAQVIAGALAPTGTVAEVQQLPADVLLVQRHNVDTDGTLIGEEWACPRIVRVDPALRYVGRIHEHIAYVGQPVRPLRTVQTPLVLQHSGYAQTVAIDKVRRNLRILQAEIATHGMQPGYHYYLADCYYGLGDYRAAAREAEASIGDVVQMLGDGTHMYHVLLESLRHLGGQDALMLTWAERGIAAFPAQPEFYAERGMTLCALGRLEEARQSLIEALLRYEERGPRPEGGYFYAKQAGYCAARLGEIMQLLGDDAEAATWYELAARYAPQDQQVQDKIRRWQAQNANID